ncbi:TlyA family RNA methyltransferase [Marinisporobacter balticus]|uniref:23S rRNA (Cytidine1920-2'-O)/16S rRNA (Cytidine1409-2'-O)-methyltransferase n=1 Tax=Marinisporobacter balticus TaxID=2018667 RepID=A0A4R2L0W3_9FIRM|nr:TlyA family RNA methyltransferase [Marinisporobacter balticus]TCO79202.1 23S rRNA (cytidine1920-2'-O)/16S rRNA (cytidine1409-2'-O)-methyltransferase [Marinisporobacter balticus]
MGETNRLDILLVERGFFDSREKAKRSIMAGIIFVENQRVDKVGTKVHKDANIEIKGKTLPYVSRGGLKLEKAMKDFHINLLNKKALDIGASTGGFTDCMLINGAEKVFAIDVGYGQLAWKLRQDERVVTMERTNIRYVTPEDINEEIDFASIDVSFISLKLVLPVVKKLIKNDGEVVCLIKPQFEAGREKVGKKGVVRDIKVHKEVLRTILSFALDIGFTVKGVSFSPIKGPEGNIEYLAHLINREKKDEIDVEDLIHDIVSNSHDALNKI